MAKVLSILSLLCLGIFLASCLSGTPIYSEPGVQQVGPPDWGLHHPIWSPDGKEILATNTTHGHSFTSEIFIIDLPTGKIRSIEYTEYGNLEGRSWSPDGGQIAFSSVRGGDWPEAIWLADAHGTNPKQLLIEGNDAAWAPDGHRMAILSRSMEGSNQKSVLSILDLRTMESKLVFSEVGKYTVAEGLTWSPDGTKIAFEFGRQMLDVNPRFPHIDIYIVEVSTGEIIKFTDEGINRGPKWSPTANLITYIKHTTGKLDYELLISDEGGSCSRQIITKAYSADWSPDGKQLAFDYAGNLYTLDLATFLGADFEKRDSLCN